MTSSATDLLYVGSQYISTRRDTGSHDSYSPSHRFSDRPTCGLLTGVGTEGPSHVPPTSHLRWVGGGPDHRLYTPKVYHTDSLGGVDHDPDVKEPGLRPLQ